MSIMVLKMPLYSINTQYKLTQGLSMAQQIFTDIHTTGVIKFQNNFSGATGVDIKNDGFNIVSTRIY
ncbi:hypothetical protein Sharanji_gp451 [Escherichia phage Sharanji]|nr:hypothetical protein Sharanji_gp451 [Escherichia phage Sharanji]